MLKATSVDVRGCESAPVDLEVNESGYVLLPEDPNAVAYHLYAPFFDQPESGPWYFKRAISRREARAARFTVVGLYRQRDLLPLLCPERPMTFGLPDPMPGQTCWMSYINGRPFAIIGVL